MRAHPTAAFVLVALVIAGNAGLAQAPQNVLSAREAHEALVAAALYVLESDSLRFKGDTHYVLQPSVRRLRAGRPGPIAVTVQVNSRFSPGVERGQGNIHATNLARALTNGGIDARAVEGATISQACAQLPRSSGLRGSRCDFAGALSLAMTMEYPQLNRDRLIVPMSVFSDQLGADGTAQTVGVTVVLNLVGGHWQVTGHQRLVGR